MWTSGFFRYEHLYTYKKQNSKTFLKENYPIAFGSCYIFTKKMLNMELKMMLMVLMEFVILDIPELYSRFNVYPAI